MATNHGGDPLGSILGPMGSHWVKKMVQKRKKLPCPKIRIFDYPAIIDFLHQLEVTVMARNHIWDPVGSIMGPMGSHWVKKMGQKRKKLPCPKIRIFDYPAVIDILQQMEDTVMALNHDVDPVGSILGPMGSHWVQKMGQNRKKITTPQNSNFRLPCDYRFFPKNGSSVLTPNHGDDSPGSILGPMGSHWFQKMGQNRKNLPCLKIRLPRSHQFLEKMEVTVMAPSHGGDPVGSILGPMGSHWVQKMGQNRTNLPCPNIRIFDYPAIIDFSQKMEVTVMATNHGGDYLGSILRSMGSLWVKKNGSKA